MKRVWLFALFALLAATAAFAEGPSVVVVPSTQGPSLTAEETAALEQQVRDAYRHAVDKLVNLLGDEALRARLLKIPVEIRDLPGADPVSMTKPKAGTTDADAQMAVAFDGWRGFLDYYVAQSLLEFVRATTEVGPYGTGPIKPPAYVKSSMANYANGRSVAHLAARLNGPEPILAWGGPEEKLKIRRMAKKHVFMECYSRVYGERAARGLARDYIRQTPWLKALAISSGEDDWKAVRGKVNACRDNVVEDLFYKAGSIREATRAERAGNDRRVVEVAERALADHPDDLWQVSIQWRRADALERTGSLDEALAVLTKLHDGGFGINLHRTESARAIVRVMTEANRCEDAQKFLDQARRTDNELNKHDSLKETNGYFDNCNPATALRFQARKLRYAGDWKGAEDEYESSIDKAKTTPDRYAWARAVRAEMADMWRDAGEFGDALKADERVLADCRKQEPDRRALIADALVAVAKDHEGLKEWKDAEAALTEALELYKQSTGPFDPRLPRVEGFLGRVYQQAGNTAEARKALESAFAGAEARLKKHDPLIADAALDLAVFLKEQGENARALELGLRAKGIYVDTYPTDDPRMARASALVDSLAP